MKILIIGNGSFGNLKNREFYINNHTGKFLMYLKESHEITFVQNTSNYCINNNLQNFEMVKNGIDFFIIKSNKKLFEILKLFKLILKYDIIYIFFPGTLSRIAGIISILLKKKFGLYIRGQFFNQFKTDKIILRKSQFILTVSPGFISRLKPFTKNIEVIKPMISINKEDIDYSRKYLIPNKWNFLFVGRVEFRKGINELIEIAEFLKYKKLNFVLNIAGGGDLYDSTNELIREKDLSDYIMLLGQVTEKETLMNLYKNADAFIFTSHDEGFPRVLYEAMATGLPIFTTFVGGIPGRMKDSFNCIEIPVKHGLISAQTIETSIKNVNLLKMIGVNGQQTLTEIVEGEYFSHEELFISKIQNL